MKLKIQITIILITLLAGISLGQTPDIYTLKLNLNRFYTDDFEIMSFCNDYKHNNIKLEGTHTIDIDNEEYILNQISKDFYNSLNLLSFGDKCKLIYAMESIRIKSSELSNNLKFCQQLLFLPSIISQLDPYYKSEGYTFGIWGLKYIPAIRYGISADSCYDERLDLEKSTQVAIRYLQDLHSQFKSWDYSITAYSLGAAKVRIFYNKGVVFDSIAQTIDTDNTFYKFLGLCKWVEDNDFPQKTLTKENLANHVDTVEITNIVHFKQIAEVLNLDYDSLKLLNPLYINDIINGKNEKRLLTLPLGYSEKYLSLGDTIYRHKDSIFFASILSPNKKISTKENTNIDSQSQYIEIKHKIEYGENLGGIALKYGVSISDIQKWNSLNNNKIYAGKELKILIKEKRTNNKTKLTQPKPESQLFETYTVKANDSPYSIAKNYPWASPEDIMEWNNIANPSKIQIGQKLKIFKNN